MAQILRRMQIWGKVATCEWALTITVEPLAEEAVYTKNIADQVQLI